MNALEQQFKDELEILRTESESAVQFIYAWQAVNTVASVEESVLGTLNEAPLFWNTALGALQAAGILALGRLFDPNTSNHSATRVLTLAHKNIAMFSKSALASRRLSEDPSAASWLPSFIKSVYEPTGEDFRRLKRHVATRRKTFEANYQPIRHRLLAHRAVTSDVEIDALFKGTNTRELQLIAVFLTRLHQALWEAFNNGRKPVLRPARYSVRRMRELPTPKFHSTKVHERLTREVGQTLARLARET
jgi:hypothetical protein